MAVRAYVGAADYFDIGSRSQNDMVRAIRSPGSTLKPFVYGLAFDDLLIHPETIVTDRPMRFGDYAPQNFDHRFHGELTAREALQLSLNLPAVALLSRVGPLRFAGLFRDVGLPLHLPDPGQAPGLPIVLGGVGTSLEDLVTLYAGIAAGGSIRPLRLTPADPLGAPRKFMSPVAAWYLTRILGETPPPPSWLAGTNRAHAPLVAYKTGTSYGFRDAWAIGYTARLHRRRLGRPARRQLLPRSHGTRGGSTHPLRRLRSAPHPPDPRCRRRPRARWWRPMPSCPPCCATSMPGRCWPGCAPPAEGKGGPEIAFPVDGSTIALIRQGQALKSLPLDADGGALPLLWLVNGKRIDSTPFRREAEWQPDGPGEVRITVIDGAGRVASSEVWVQ